MCLENYIDRLCVSYYYEFVRLCKSVRCLRIKEIHAIFCPLISVVLLCVVPYTPACKIDRYDMRCVHTYVSGKYAKNVDHYQFDKSRGVYEFTAMREATVLVCL